MIIDGAEYRTGVRWFWRFRFHKTPPDPKALAYRLFVPVAGGPTRAYQLTADDLHATSADDIARQFRGASYLADGWFDPREQQPR